jgi:hypothetical protein
LNDHIPTMIGGIAATNVIAANEIIKTLKEGGVALSNDAVRHMVTQIPEIISQTSDDILTEVRGRLSGDAITMPDELMKGIKLDDFKKEFWKSMLDGIKDRKDILSVVETQLLACREINGHDKEISALIKMTQDVLPTLKDSAQLNKLVKRNSNTSLGSLGSLGRALLLLPQTTKASPSSPSPDGSPPPPSQSPGVSPPSSPGRQSSGTGASRLSSVGSISL